MKHFLLFFALIGFFKPGRSQESARLDTFSLQNIPGIAAMTLKKHQQEINFYNAYAINQKIYHYDNFFKLVESGDRLNTFFQMVQMTWGVSRKQNFNIGADLGASYFFYRADPKNIPNTEGYAPTARFGPRIRWRPFGSIGRDADLVIQSNYYMNIYPGKSIDASYFESTTQIFYFKYLFPEKLVFQIGTGFGFLHTPNDESKPPQYWPSTLFAGYYPRRDLILFSYLNFFQEFGEMFDGFDVKYTARRSALSLGFGSQITFNYRFRIYLIPQVLLKEKYGGGTNQVILGLQYFWN